MTDVLLDHDPVAATNLMSEVLGVVWAGVEYDRVDAVCGATVQIAQEVPLTHPAALLALTVLGELAPEPVRPVIAERLALARERRSAVGPERPWWLPAVGDVALRDAVAYMDVFGDQTNYLLGFAHRRPGTTDEWFGEHTVIVLVDHNLHLIKDMFTRPGLEPLAMGREISRADDGLLELPFDPREAAEEITNYLRMTDMTMGEPFGDESAGTRALVGARLRALPEPRATALEDTDERWPEKQRASAVNAFMRTKAVQELCDGVATPDEPPSRETVRYLARLFVDYRCDYVGADPWGWSPTAVELFLTDWAPRKVLWDPDDAGWVPEVLAAWVEHGGRKRGIAKRFREESLDAIDDYQLEFLQAVSDGSRLGPAAQLVSAMADAGVDLTDEEQVALWIAEYNASLPQPFED